MKKDVIIIVAILLATIVGCFASLIFDSIELQIAVAVLAIVASTAYGIQNDKKYESTKPNH